MYRTVHTLKGNFGQLDFVHIVPRLHEFETKLSACKRELLEAPPESLAEFVASHRLSDWLEEDLTLLEQTLGDAFLRTSNVLTIEEEKITGLERKIGELLPPPAADELLAELRKLRYRPFSELLAKYSDWVRKAAANLGKPIYPLVVEQTEPILVDPERYRPFVRSLVHVFNNMLDHGIEEAEERALSGKDPIGLIICAVSSERDTIRLIIANDGKDIDAGQIRARAVAKGIYSAETAARLTDEELMSCIFLDGFSTKDGETALSGRGVGLAAVKRETERIGGSVRVESVRGAGTTFVFRLPFHGMKGGV
ncbi:hypothetical protein SD70_21765 [Gordoniibacillus kamchatkensis]|uniref:histidine kinase n=1 Tax=Gordoniibacillus kamchatkensis TaxID=1590651 RepID=A0ABR5AEC5_9BACL|nr:ATP-binding protein [Paenibacillus sp. VKM B-2647]KIL39173.1 hypothetical protein SD70_21765 [Paenibacillus sp. VKM B-2647]